jgi:phosphonoacetate hydrolase
MIRGENQRVVVGMIDGFDIDYFIEEDMPFMTEMARNGFFRQGKSIFPSLTNANNISIACGAWPETHGVTTNCYYDEQSGTARFLESADFLLSPTIFAKARAQGMESALLTCKAKTAKIVGQDATLSIAAEEPTPEIVEQFGQPPPMYSCEINYWLWNVAAYLLEKRPELKLIYVHTTDYPMHMWPAEAEDSRAHMRELDAHFKRISDLAPDAVMLITADHGMNFKTRCWDLAKACENRGLTLKFAVSPLADRLLKHHRGFGGVAYVHLHADSDRDLAKQIIGDLDGIESVLDGDEAARRFKLMKDRVGDLVVLPDQETVFGDLETEYEVLAPEFRSHGSLYDMDIPLLIHNAQGDMPDESELQVNLDLTRCLFTEKEKV